MEIEFLIMATRDWILSLIEPEKIYLFGSAARGEMNSLSDLDLIIIGKKEQDLNSFRRMIFGSPRPHAWPLDLLFYTQSNFVSRSALGGVCFLAVKEGRVLYP